MTDLLGVAADKPAQHVDSRDERADTRKATMMVLSDCASPYARTSFARTAMYRYLANRAVTIMIILSENPARASSSRTIPAQAPDYEPSRSTAPKFRELDTGLKGEMILSLPYGLLCGMKKEWLKTEGELSYRN